MKQAVNSDSGDAKKKKVFARRQKIEERISQEYETSLYDYIGMLAEKVWDADSVYDEKTAAYDEYLQNNLTVSPGGGGIKNRIRRVTYGADSLNALMRIADLNYYDLFNQVFAPVAEKKRAENHLPLVRPPELKPDAVALRDLCDSLPAKELDKVRKLALELSPSFWSTSEAQKWTPCYRIAAVIKNQLPGKLRVQSLPKEIRSPKLASMMHDVHSYQTPLEDLPVVAKYFDVSYHWLMMGDDTVCATAKNPRTELVLTAYGFMSEDMRRRFLEIVQYVFGGHGKEGC